jgi:hypothetical protein
MGQHRGRAARHGWEAAAWDYRILPEWRERRSTPRRRSDYDNFTEGTSPLDFVCDAAHGDSLEV